MFFRQIFERIHASKLQRARARVCRKNVQSRLRGILNIKRLYLNYRSTEEYSTLDNVKYHIDLLSIKWLLPHDIINSFDEHYEQEYFVFSTKTACLVCTLFRIVHEKKKKRIDQDALQTMAHCIIYHTVVNVLRTSVCTTSVPA